MNLTEAKDRGGEIIVSIYMSCGRASRCYVVVVVVVMAGSDKLVEVLEVSK